MKPIPVVLFAYARLDLLLQALQCLRKNGVPLLYVYADGAQMRDDVPRVERVRVALRGVDWCDLHLVERSENLGLGRSILRGVREVLGDHDSAIVVEDDLLCVPGTYDYMCAALRRYRDDPVVMSVTGWTHPRVTPAGVVDQPYFDGRTSSWLWGTWARAWEGMDVDALTMAKECRREGVDPRSYGADLLKMARMEETRNIWAVRFCYHHMRNHGLCLRPPWSMVDHVGVGDGATNAALATEWSQPELRPCPPLPETWPAPAEHPDCSRIWRSVRGGRPVRDMFLGLPYRARHIARRLVQRAKGACRIGVKGVE